ncbi:hypothetical protein HDF16_004253 [Granulicella aggregans]|uniref:Uncharacterized protein n=1 Tax=Granulicella aggregans TaxID=474949 RepID=A0A7W7ZGN7_9BACT|nr:hypothetical protein [Granulicella aggregans]MBB5059527.1 hypothetical protein [Granulicella aggregans]
MTRLLPTFALGLSLATVAVAGTPTAFAESESLMTVTVPFSFTANNTAFPAGTYSLRASEHYLRLTNASNGKTSVVITRYDDGTANRGTARLTFHQHSGQTYLAQVWTNGSNLHSELLSHPKPNREIGQANLPDRTFEIATK